MAQDTMSFPCSISYYTIYQTMVGLGNLLGWEYCISSNRHLNLKHWKDGWSKVTWLSGWRVDSEPYTVNLAGRSYSHFARTEAYLGSKLILSYTKDENPVILSFSETRRDRSSSDAEETTSPTYQAHLRTFLAYLVFWQDLVEHCASFDVRHTLLDHFKFLFLQQLL